MANIQPTKNLDMFEVGRQSNSLSRMADTLNAGMAAYHAQNQMQQKMAGEQANAMALEGKKNEGALAVQGLHNQGLVTSNSYKNAIQPVPEIPGVGAYDPMNPPWVTRGGSTFLVEPDMGTHGFQGWKHQSTQPPGMMALTSADNPDTNSLQAGINSTKPKSKVPAANLTTAQKLEMMAEQYQKEKAAQMGVKQIGS